MQPGFTGIIACDRGVPVASAFPFLTECPVTSGVNASAQRVSPGLPSAASPGGWPQGGPVSAEEEGLHGSVPTSGPSTP